MKPHNANTNLALQVCYKVRVRNKDGITAKILPGKKNLILDSGLNMIGTTPIADCFRYAAVGTGTTPTNRDSGSTAFGFEDVGGGLGTITADASFFESGDVGRLFKFDTGEEFYITTFNSSTIVTVANPNSVGDFGDYPGTVWYVNETAHGSESKRTNSYITSGGGCGTTVSLGVVTMKRTFLFSAEAGPVLYKEIGWGNASSGNLFGRDLINAGAGIALSAGQQLEVEMNFILELSPQNEAVADVTGGAWNTAGTAGFTSLERCISYVNSNGSSYTSYGTIEPSGTACGIARLTSSVTIPASPPTPTGSFPSTVSESEQQKAMSLEAYSPGTFYRDKTVTIPITEWNATIHGLAVGQYDSGAGRLRHAYIHNFTTPIAKAATHTLALTFRTAWSRTLTN